MIFEIKKCNTGEQAIAIERNIFNLSRTSTQNLRK
jgi:hypothetical protein